MFGKNKKDVVAVSTLPLEEFEFLLGRNSILCGNLQTKGHRVLMVTLKALLFRRTMF